MSNPKPIGSQTSHNCTGLHSSRRLVQLGRFVRELRRKGTAVQLLVIELTAKPGHSLHCSLRPSKAKLFAAENVITNATIG